MNAHEGGQPSTGAERGTDVLPAQVMHYQSTDRLAADSKAESPSFQMLPGREVRGPSATLIDFEKLQIIFHRGWR